jgi:hypothetical protein
MVPVFPDHQCFENHGLPLLLRGFDVIPCPLVEEFGGFALLLLCHVATLEVALRNLILADCGNLSGPHVAGSGEKVDSDSAGDGQTRQDAEAEDAEDHFVSVTFRVAMNGLWQRGNPIQYRLSGSPLPFVSLHP